MREAVVSFPSWEMLNGDGMMEPMALVSPVKRWNTFLENITSTKESGVTNSLLNHSVWSYIRISKSVNGT